MRRQSGPVLATDPALPFKFGKEWDIFSLFYCDHSLSRSMLSLYPLQVQTRHNHLEPSKLVRLLVPDVTVAMTTTKRRA